MKEEEKLQELNFRYKDKIKLVTLGFIANWKNQLKLINLMPKLLETHKNIVLFIIGSSKYAPNYYKSCVSKIKKLKLLNNIIIKDEFITDSDYKIYLKFADIYLARHKNKIQTCSGSLCYAIYSRKPIVASPISYLSSKNLKQCILIANNDNEYIAQINRLISDNNLVLKLKQACSVVSKEWSWNNVSKHYFKVYLNSFYNFNKNQILKGPKIFIKYPKSIGELIRNKNFPYRKIQGYYLYNIMSFPFSRFGHTKLYQRINIGFVKLQINIFQKMLFNIRI